MTEFDDATAVAPLGAGRYDASIDPGWRIGSGVNGGYLLALMGRAISAELTPVGHLDPITMSACYLLPPRPGHAWISVTVLRSGGSLSVARATLVQMAQQDGDLRRATPRMEVLATFGALEALTGDVSTTATPFRITPIEHCLASSGQPPKGLAEAEFLKRVDLRLDPQTAGWAIGRPSGAGMIQGWLGLAEHRDPDPFMLLLAVDALVPVSFDLGMPGWAPTVELTAHLRALPAPGMLRVRQATRNVAGGMFEEDCEVWDSADRLVAQARQLARLPR